MKKVIGFFRWLIRIWSSIGGKAPPVAVSNEKSKCKIEFVEDLPIVMPINTYFIVKDGLEPELLGFKCPCGCGSDILLNLLQDASPRWSYSITEKNQIDIHPSVWRNSGCRSHFFVSEGKIKWV